jgi:hypothetical protein
MLRFLDFVVGLAAIWLALKWGDGNTAHQWIVAILIAVATIVSYVRGIARE